MWCVRNPTADPDPDPDSDFDSHPSDADTCVAQWAAVTLVIVGSMELVGATAWLGVQRFMGNVAGGFLGYAGVTVSDCALDCSGTGIRIQGLQLRRQRPLDP